MSKPIIVGYDPETADRAPVNFGVAAARFTGAPLIIASASAHAGDHDRAGAGQHDEDLVVDALGSPRRRPSASSSPKASRSSAGIWPARARRARCTS